ncbi:MAG TPA: 4-(cytidine 5'-diphospho)-2-C-methyl-D-erythritol kinase [Candidatus Cloacimonas sp.]|jgi:4-diphosphocytidyl-2-C-methyl-D-erythritol kinase|nr:4-(cytidine 5'-diphospho)-2-C-methyl-D-erythritol kinase [Candidatus Cloacimonas sp.]
MQAASCAKINLSLEVLGKLPDGYTRIETLFASIDLQDRLRFTLTKSQGIKLWSNLPQLNTKDNLIYKVAHYLQSRFNPDSGVEIELIKDIPIAAGLGGGSSNAAVTLLILNKLWSLHLSEEELHNIAATFGSDVNFFLMGGTALGEERGQQITPVDDILLENLLLVNPHIAISSFEAYQLVDHEALEPSFSYLDAIQKGVYFNRLQQGIVKKYPVIGELLGKMREHGASAALMSGSGSTCFGIFNNKAALEACRDEFDDSGFWTQATRTISKEEYYKCTRNLSY